MMDFPEFPPATKSSWQKQINKFSKGESITDNLIYNPQENIVVSAYCDSEDIFDKNNISIEGQEPFEICVPIDIRKSDWLSVLNESVDSFDFCYEGLPIPEVLSKFKLHLTINLSDISHFTQLTKHGYGGTITLINDETQEDSDNDKFELLQNLNSRFKTLGIDITRSDSKDESELLCQAVEQADRFIKKKLKAEYTDISNIFFRLPLGTDFYLNLAKIRALKQCWYNLLDNYNLPLCNPFIIAETPDLSLIENETEQNIIRATAMAFASIAGGANVFIPRGLKDIEKQPESFSLRMSRNIQLLLKEESFTTFVSDPAKGSYFIENLTKNLAEAAWNKFSDSIQSK